MASCLVATDRYITNISNINRRVLNDYILGHMGVNGINHREEAEEG